MTTSMKDGIKIYLFTSRIVREVWEIHGEMGPEILTDLWATF